VSEAVAMSRTGLPAVYHSVTMPIATPAMVPATTAQNAPVAP
jgi:hypothetical protein